MKRSMTIASLLAVLTWLPAVAEARTGSSKARAARAAGTPGSVKKARGIRSMTKAEKIRAFFKMVRAMGKVPKSCRFKGKKLWGKVKIVESFPDFKVKRVSSFPDLKVKWVSSFPDKCGKWKKVSSFPDFKIKWVTSFPDFTIKEVTSFPGVR